MAAQSAKALKQAFLDAYGGFADKRIKNIDKGTLFTIDGRSPRDEDAAGKLFGWFCQISAEVIDKDTVRITMDGDIPNGPLVAKWLAESGAQKTHSGLQFDIRRGGEGRLSELATAFRAIVSAGERYPVRSYKHVCPRVAAALDHAQSLLHKAWQTP
jgi:hypothetical protein